MKIEITPDCESEIVAQSLKDYHRIMFNDPEEDGVVEAIEKVLSHYLSSSDYKKWYKSVYDVRDCEKEDD